MNKHPFFTPYTEEFKDKFLHGITPIGVLLLYKIINLSLPQQTKKDTTFRCPTLLAKLIKNCSSLLLSESYCFHYPYFK